MASCLVVVSDIHAGCRMALCPPNGVPLCDGGTYMPSEFQTKLARMWCEWWNVWVPRFTDGLDYDVVINGETVDGRHHGSTTQISQNLEDQKAAAVALLKPVRDMCPGRFFVVSGTPAHSGEQGCDDEAVARELGAEPDASGRHARYGLLIDVGGALVDVLHHIGTTSSSAYESTAVYKELVESYVEAGRWGDRPPDVVVRSHRHRYFEAKVASARGQATVVVTPGWQGKTPFAYRIAGARMSQPQFGGIVIRTSDTEPYVRHHVWRLERGNVE